MTDARPTPTREQAAAIADSERDLFLAAGAGTGKTTVLVQRYCDVVCATSGADAETGIDNVVAFTFTDRAAGELKRRIRAELLRRAAADRDRGLELRRLARDAESAWISTIHGFCRRVLASHSLAAGLDPRFAVLSESEALRVAEEAFDLAFADFGAAGHGDDRFEMAAAFGVDSLARMVITAHDDLRSQGHQTPELPEVAGADVGAAIAELRAAASEALAQTATATGSWAARHRERLAAALTATDGRVPEEGEAEQWRFKSSAAEFDLDSVRAFELARRRLDASLAEAGFAHYYAHLRELLRLYGARYAERKRARSALDFEDLQLRTRELLRANAAIRHGYQQRFRHLMVDEFQDTNRLQASLVDLLRREQGARVGHLFSVGDELQSIYSFRHADVEVFRIRAAAAAAEEAAAGERGDRSAIAFRRLTGNFRSAPEVLALVNAVGRDLFPDAYEPLAAVGPEGPGAVELLVSERKGWPEEGDPQAPVSPDEHAQPWRLAEARALAKRLAELVDGGADRGDIVVLLRSYSHVDAYEAALAEADLRPFVIGGRGYWSRQQVSDVRSLLACIANPLDDRALFDVLASPAGGLKPDGLWLLRKAAGRAPLWWALRRLFGQGADAVEAEAALPDQAGPPEDDAGPETDAARTDEGESWSEQVERWGREVDAADAAAAGACVEAIERLRADAPRLALDDLIERAISATGYDLALLMRPGGRRRMANVRKLMRLAREFEADRGRDLRGFLDWIAREADTSRREAEAAITAEGHDGVRVMTIHAAKGLEFPIVAVADLGRTLAASYGTALRLAPAGEGREEDALRVGLRLARLGRRRVAIFEHEALDEEAAERERAEERRLLHVAMTRAQRRLILSGAIDTAALAKEPGRTEPLIGSVLRALRWSPEATAPLTAGAVEVGVRLTRPPADSEAGAEPAAAAARPPLAADEPAAEPVGRLSAPDFSLPAASAPDTPITHVSYSALSLYERCGYRFYAERVLGLAAPAGDVAATAERPAAGTEPRRHGHAIGTVVHELLEASARSGWAPPDRGLGAALVEREGLRPDALARAESLVGAFLDSPLCSQLRAARAIHAELPFSFRLGPLVVRGEIDLVAEADGEVHVVDYKSDALGDDAPADRMDRYRLQRDIYAFAALRRFGVPVRVVYSFLERPDDPVARRYLPDEAGALEATLAEAAAGVAAGRFAVTDTPGRALCFDCPARRRLCSHDESRTLA